MKRILIAVAAAAGVAVLAGETQAAGAQPPYLTPAPPAGSADIYGPNPFLKKLMFWKKDDCGSTGKGCSKCQVTPPEPMPGTLVFPFNPYMRSPRDFFMYEPK